VTARPTHSVPIRQVAAAEVRALASADDQALASLRDELVANFRTGPRAIRLQGFDPATSGEQAFAASLERIGGWLGTLSHQSPRGEAVARVEHDPRDRQARGTYSDSELRPHTDMHDILALACVRKAATGGDSFLVPADRLYRLMQAQAPEHLAALYEGYYFGTNPVLRSARPVSATRVPVFLPDPRGGSMQCCCNGYFLRAAAQFRGEPLPPVLEAALAMLHGIAARLADEAQFGLAEGEIVIWHNWSWLHGRTAFVDSPAHRRLLLRLWLRSELVPRAQVLADRATQIDADHALSGSAAFAA
jgi:hypothetical protein